MLKDTNAFYGNIFKKRHRPDGVSIETFLKDLKDKPEVLKKKLTEAEKMDADKKIEVKELKETLDRGLWPAPRPRATQPAAVWKLPPAFPVSRAHRSARARVGSWYQPEQPVAFAVVSAWLCANLLRGSITVCCNN